jgi:hypothetical protein
MFPSYWSEFLEANALVHREVSIPEVQDLSGVGADLEMYDAESSRQEMEEYYPGIVVAADGFVPVAHCSIGSGDPYFINVNDGPGGPLYRVYHDVVANQPYERSQAVDLVLASYQELVRYAVA